MAENYQLVTSQSSTQVLSPTVVQEMVVATIQTLPHRVIADYWLTREQWDGGDAARVLTAFAANIERIMDDPHVLRASSGRSLDPSGLVASELTVTVGYSTPGSGFPPATVDVVIPASDLRPAESRPGGSGVDAALAIIDTAYQQLATAAGAAPQQAGSTAAPTE